MIRVFTYKGNSWVQMGVLLTVSPISADLLLVMCPDPKRGAQDLHHIEIIERHRVRLQWRTPIPLFDPSFMGGRDAAIPAARAASTSSPTEELQDARYPDYQSDAICCGG